MTIPTISQLNISSRVAYGDAILKRMREGDAPKVSGKLARLFDTFRAAHKSYLVCVQQAAGAQDQWDDAAKAVSDADTRQDNAVDKLVVAIIAARFRPRTKPLKGLTPYAPVALQTLAFKVEAEEILKLNKKLLREKAPAKVKAAGAAAAKAAQALLTALKDESLPKRAFARTKIARAKEELAWDEALTRFRLKAKGDWMDEAGAFAGIFEEVSREQQASKAKSAATRKRRTKKKSDGATPQMNSSEIKVKGGPKQTRKTTTTTTETVTEGPATTDPTKTVS